MAYGFQVPRQRPRPLTQGAQLAEDQNTRGLATGNFGDVQSARGATDRSNALRTSNALQATRGTFARSGVDTSPEAAARAQDQSFSAAEGQNLNGTNAVNQLQRQYRNDAVTNANQYEAAANQRQQQGVSNDQFDKTFGANREDAATARNQFGLNYNAGRDDANTSKNQFGETMAQRKNEFGVSSGQSQQQIDNQSKQFLTSQAQRDKEFGVSSGQNQQQINNQASQFGQNYAAGREDAADSRSRFDLSRGDTNAQFDKTLGQRQSEFGVSSGQNQQQINNQASQFGQNYAAGREDAATAKNQFDLTRGDKNSQFNVTATQNQQQIDNQAEQAAKKLGYDYASLSQNDKQFFQKMAQEDDQFLQKTNFDYNSLNQNQSQFDAKIGQDDKQFGVTSGQNQQQIDNQSSQFRDNFNQNRSQFESKLSQDNRQFGITSGQTQQQIDASKSQFDLTRGDKQKAMTMDEINTIQDPVARNLALKAYYGGGDVGRNVGAAIGGNIDSKGQLINKSMSPGTAAYQAKVDELQATYPDKSQAQIEQMVRDRAIKSDTLTQGVTDTQTKVISQQTSMDNLSKLKPGEKPNPEDLNNIPSINSNAIPTGEGNVQAWLKENTTGGWTKINGVPYKVESGGKWMTRDGTWGKSDLYEAFTTVKDESGNKRYINEKGQLVNKKPGT